MIVNGLKKIKHYFGSRYRTVKLLLYEYFILSKNLGSGRNKRSQRASLIITAHIIEKGLSLKEVRPGFGQEKIVKLLNDLKIYYNRYKDKEILFFVLSIIEAYLNFSETKGVRNNEILELYTQLSANVDDNCRKYEYLRGGVTNISKDKIIKNSCIPYHDFVASRHSIRNFTGESIDIQSINRALEMAAYTPSACNRQPWGNYVFINKNMILKILDFQTGARQFKNDISCVILVTSTYSSFFGGEYHQPYVNGGMYSMNLIFALHSLGLGTISLNMGLSMKKLKELKNICDIRDDEVPIMLIGIGVISDDLNVANSRRFNYKNYTKYY